MPRTLCQQLRSPSILLLQDLCLAPSLGALAEPVCPRNPLKLDHRGTVKRLWLALVRGLCPQQLNCLHILEVLGRNRDQAGLGNRRIRGCLHTTDLGAARASLTRTRSVSTIATWTSSGSTLLSELAPGLGEEYVCARPEASGFFFAQTSAHLIQTPEPATVQSSALAVAPGSTTAITGQGQPTSPLRT